MLYEYRHYCPAPGKFEALKARFRDHTVSLFDLYGVRAVGFWESVSGEMWNVHYLLEWESMAERELKWERFATSSEWQKVRAQTEVDGPLVSTLSVEFW